MGTGYLKVQTRTGGGALPLEGAEIFISYPDGRIIGQTRTDQNGDAEVFGIQAPDARFTLDPNYSGPLYTAVNVTIMKDGFVTVHVRNVQIFDTSTTVLPMNMEPLGERNNASDKYIDIPPPGLSPNDKDN